MANVAAPFGFAAVGTISGSPYTGRTTRYWIPSTDPNAYYIGDPVISLANSDSTGVPGVIKATAGTETVRGVITGVEAFNVGVPGSVASLAADPLANLGQVSIPATKGRDYYVFVVDDPDALFMVQGDSDTTKQIATSANKNASFTVAAPSPATNALSASVITGTTIATTQSLNVRLIGLAQIPGNGFGAFATWIVKWNQHELMGNTAGI